MTPVSTHIDLSYGNKTLKDDFDELSDKVNISNKFKPDKMTQQKLYKMIFMRYLTSDSWKDKFVFHCSENSNDDW